MATAKVKQQRIRTVDTYFTLIRDLRNGRDGSVQKLVDLWDEDGTFEFCGAPPVTGMFRGRMAIHTLYQNRFHQSGMKLELFGNEAAKRAAEEVALGVVDTEVNRVRALDKDDRVVAGWTTRIGTHDGRGFNVSGSHSFKFKDDKIVELRIVMSPKPDAAPGLKMEGLAVEDIGRLALAAWPVIA